MFWWIRSARIRHTSLCTVVLGLACLALPGCTQPPTEEEIDEPAQLAEIRQLIRDADFANAESRARELLTEFEQAHGVDSLEVAQTLDVLVESLWRAGRDRTPEARELAERAVDIKRERFGDKHAQTAASLRNLAIVFEDTGNLEEAGALYERIVGIRERAGAAGEAKFAAALIDLAIFHQNQSRYGEARDVYLRALDVQENSIGREHLDVALTLSNLAGVYRQLGEYESARSHFEEALAIRTKLEGADHLDVAWTLTGLAAMNQELGDYSKAVASESRALAIRRAKLPPDHLHLTWNLNNLAYFLRLQGDYAQARDLYEQALEIQTQSLDPDHPNVAVTLNNLGELLYLTGDYEPALALYERALAIRRQAHGTHHTDVATVLDKMSALLARVGDYQRARQLAEQALEIRGESLGTDHVEYATSLIHLARILEQMGEIAQAKKYYGQTTEILQRISPQHPLLAENLNNLANLLLTTGDTASAVATFERALDLRERSLGVEHPLVGETLIGLSSARAMVGDSSTALEQALRCERIGRNHLRLTARTLSERQALAYASVRSSALDLALSLAAADPSPETIREVWDALILSRATVLDEMALRHRPSAREADEETKRLWTNLRQTSTRLANLMVRGPDPEHPERYTVLLQAARQENDEAERALAQVLANDPARTLEQASLDQVLRTLPDDTALVAFARYRKHVVTAEGHSAKKSRTPGPYAYGAFILTGKGEAPAMVSLADAESIDRLVADWRREITRPQPSSGQARRDAERNYRAVGNTLREAVWDPVARKLGDVERVFVVPDGELNLVSFYSFPVSDDAYLIERGPLIHFLSAERDMVRESTRSDAEGDLLALGGPAFDAETTRDETTSFRGGRSDCGDFASIRFERLRHATREAQRVAAHWRKSDPAMTEVAGEASPNVLLLTGEAATEAAFKENAAGKQVLHLATHGFFLGAGCSSGVTDSRGIGGLSSADGTGAQPVGENPLLLSGLVLAGANLRNTRGADQEDGILTAEEVAALDLSRTEWAVLSACDTGVGEVRSGEGVFGLRRAFQVAGADTVIMSLWSVADLAARDWMDELYRGRRERGMQTAEAVRAASLRVMEQYKEDTGSSHPFFWAGFVAAGDWR